MTNEGYIRESAKEIAALGERLQALLRLRTNVIALKIIDKKEDLQNIKGIRRPESGTRFSACQLIGQARFSGFTLGISHENVVANSNCGGVLGLNEPGEFFLSGKAMDGVWFGNKDAAHSHQKQMPRMPVTGHEAVAVSPIRSARLDDPNIILFYGTPGQMILFINGLQYHTYERLDLSITGESACADSWGRALKQKKPSLSIPCFAERRFGGVADDELLMALPPAYLKRGVEGLEALSKNGIRYPITPYGASSDPMPSLKESYGPELD